MKTITLILLLSIPTFAQSWTQIFELPKQGITFSVRNHAKIGDVYSFDGKREYTISGNAQVDRLAVDCKQTKAFILGTYDENKLVLAEKPIEIGIVKTSAIEAVFGYFCGKKIEKDSAE